MGAAVSSVRSRLFHKDSLNILMVGLDAAGKTTILHNLNLGEVVTTMPTIGFELETVEYARRTHIVSFTTWTLGGRGGFRALYRHFYDGKNALIFVVDSCDRDRIEDAKDQLSGMLSEDRLRSVPLLIFANKQDLRHRLPMVELVDRLGLNQLRNRAWFIQPCTATTGDGLFEGLDWLRDAAKQPRAASTAQPSGTVRHPEVKVERFEPAARPEIRRKDEGNGDMEAEASDKASTADTETLGETEL